MDPLKNPFAPGAGNRPPELAGRDQVLDEIGLALSRVIAGRHDRGHLLKGLRGVGKTVLLNEIDTMAQERGYETALIEAPEDGKLAELLVPRLRSALLRVSRKEKAKDLMRDAWTALRGFAAAFKVTSGGLEFGVAEPHTGGVADSGNLELDLPDLLLTIGRAAKAAGTGVAIIIDEVQYLNNAELGALIVAIHSVSQKGLPVLFFGGGLPQVAGNAGDAKSYSERLLRYPDIGALAHEAALDAIRKPIKAEGAAIQQDALERIVELTQGYPYFLQEWGYHTWNVAPASPITLLDVELATKIALHNLDKDFFQVRLERLRPNEKNYLRAMAALGRGPYKSGDIAKRLGEKTQGVAFLRESLIRKGMIFSPRFGVNEFTVPMFDGFMERTLPVWPAPSSDNEAADDADDRVASTRARQRDPDDQPRGRGRKRGNG